jgi:hypothetical protein
MLLYLHDGIQLSTFVGQSVHINFNLQRVNQQAFKRQAIKI